MAGVSAFLVAKGLVTPEQAFVIGANVGGLAGGLVTGATAQLPNTPQEWTMLGRVAVAGQAVAIAAATPTLEFGPASAAGGVFTAFTGAAMAGRGLRHLVDRGITSMRNRRGDSRHFTH